MRIKVQKHNLDNHQRGYSKMSASVKQEAFQEEHLSTESVRRLLAPRNVQGASIPVSLGCGRLRDPGVSSRSGSSMAQDTASHSGLDRLEISARHHPHELCEGERRRVTRCEWGALKACNVTHLRSQQARRRSGRRPAGCLQLPSDPPGNKRSEGLGHISAP